MMAASLLPIHAVRCGRDLSRQQWHDDATLLKISTSSLCATQQQLHLLPLLPSSLRGCYSCLPLAPQGKLLPYAQQHSLTRARISMPGRRNVSARAATSRSSNSAGSSGGGAAGSSNIFEEALLNGADEQVGVDYYELLGVKVGASREEIRRAYWALQKKFHPDVAGLQSHRLALLLNEAYTVLMDDGRRAEYERQWKAAAAAGFVGYTGQPRSKWNGPDWPQAIFVDEAACVGCQECVFVAPNTFEFDAHEAKARVKVQWGDPEASIKMASEACPVRCIHTVERGDLAALEFLMQPRRRESEGVYGGGWQQVERGNIFGAARAFKGKVAKQREEAEQMRAAASRRRTAAATKPPQEENMFARAFSWAFDASEDESSGQKGKGKAKEAAGGKFSWDRLFGLGQTAELLRWPVEEGEVKNMRVFVQEWASIFSCSSELPLPLPIRADSVDQGVILTLISLEGGLIRPYGSISILIEAQKSKSAGGLENVVGDRGSPTMEGDDGSEGYVLTATRTGVELGKKLPGEGQIMKSLKDALSSQGSRQGYEAYHLRR